MRAGWYDQPSPDGRLRWFDGREWSHYARVDQVPAERRHVFAMHDVSRRWGRWSTVVVTLLMACGLVNLALLGLRVWLLDALLSWQVSPPPDSTVTRVEDLESVLHVGFVASALACGVALAAWLHLAHRSDRLSAYRRRHRSVWAWLGWLVPLVNLVIPPRVLNDVRRASQPEDHPPARGLLGAWWACVLLGGTLRRVADTRPVDDLTDLEAVVRLAILADVLVVVAVALAVLLVRETTQRVLDSPYGPQYAPLTAGQRAGVLEG